MLLIYSIGTVWSIRKEMLKLKEDKKMSRGESDFYYSKNVICCKWYDGKPVLHLTKNADGMSGVSNIMRLTKSSATKTPVSCLTPSSFIAMTWMV